jgi:hypothetical protein
MLEASADFATIACESGKGEYGVVLAVFIAPAAR